METVQVMIKELTDMGIEKISSNIVDNFLNPFKKINKYQLDCINDPTKETYSSRLKRNKS